MKKYSKNFLLDLYKTMLRIRLCEESIIDPILNREVLCPCHLYSGEEAIATGICASLTKKDYVFSNHRSHGHFIAKGGSIAELLAEIYGRESGCSKGRGGSMHLIDPDVGMMGSAPIVAGTISLALGAALASQIRGEDRVTITFFGDGATGEGVLYESLNFAALKKLPIIFICENNLYATHMSIRDCRVRNKIHKIAEPFGIDNEEVDGNNVLLVYEAGKKAIGKCRRGAGPVFLECLTYRFRGHVGPDDNIQGSHTDIRPKEEIRVWLKKDPILLFEKFLLEDTLINQNTLDEIKKEIEKEVAKAHIYAKNSPLPEQKDLMCYVYR